MPKLKVAIGIDLGTSKCCVGVVRDGRLDILENERSSKTTPSFVAFTDTERLVGEDAKDQVILNPSNTVFGVKKLLGQRFGSPEVQRYLPYSLPFEVDGDEAGKPNVHVTYKKKAVKLLPEQVTAMLLSKMKQLVETRLDCVVEEAVISTPASFNNSQRKGTMDAAAIAGLKVISLVNETTAAAVAYQANRKIASKETIAVVDFGGGKLDVSVVSVKKDAVEVEATFGSSSVGGIDIDEHMVSFLMEKFYRTHGVDLRLNAKAKERLRYSCVSLKHTLSLLPEARVQLDSLFEDKDLEITVTRKEFEEVVGPRIRKVFTKIVQRVLADVLVQGLFISKVLLVGGSTRIPMVQTLLLDTFRMCRLDRSVNPDEAVAQGAALMASSSRIRVHDVALHAFYLDLGTGRLPIFERFNIVPDSRSVEIPVGRSHSASLVEWQYKLGGSCGHVLAQSFAGDSLKTKIKIKCLIDSSGIFQATPVSGLGSNSPRHVTEQNIKEMINVERNFIRDSIDESNRIAALSDLESYYFGQKSYLEAQHRKRKLSTDTFEIMSQKLKGIITWIDSSADATKQDYEDKKAELEKLCIINVSHRARSRSDDQTKGWTSRSLESQVGNGNTARQKASLPTLSDGTKEMDTSPERDTQMETLEVLKQHPDDCGTVHVGCRAKRPRTEPEGQEAPEELDAAPTQTRGAAETDHLASIDGKHFTFNGSDSVLPRHEDFTKSSFRDYPTRGFEESQALKNNNPGTTSEMLNTCKQLLDTVQLAFQKELQQQGLCYGFHACTTHGNLNNSVSKSVQHEKFTANGEWQKGKESLLRDRHLLVSKIEADIDSLVDKFADNVREDLKKMIISKV